MPRKKSHKVSLDQTGINVWEERDRLHIELVDIRNGKTIAEWWDDDARQMFEDGFFKARNLHQSVYDYLRYVEIIAP